MLKAKNTGSSEAIWLRRPAVAYTAPFLVYVAFLVVGQTLAVRQEALHVARLSVTGFAILLFSRNVVPLRPRHPLASVIGGIAVFVLWVVPDLLWPGYRAHWLFTNTVTGEAASSIPSHLHQAPLFLAVRLLSTALLVPVIEELFWRGWLMRWLVRVDFTKVSLGTYTHASFWITALLFASEHGPYWDVGLVAGVAYNAWLVRTRSLSDCMLAHAVTNACLAAYVLASGQWQYWL